MSARRSVVCAATLGVAAFVLSGAFVPGCSKIASRGVAPGPDMTDDGVRFRYYAPGASRVQLAGNWPENNWARGDGSVGEADIGLMAVDDNGMWEITVPLGPGRYYYVFWVDDNRWRTDPGNPEETEFGPFGRSSLLLVFLQGGKLEIR
jgi:1,4-alpha-glucan branching enzyme